MRPLYRLRSFLRSLMHRSAVERGIADELEFHINRHAEHLARTHGLSNAEAIRRARIDFGSVEHYKEEGRRSLGLALVDDLRRDIRYAWRTASRHGGLTTTVIARIAMTAVVKPRCFTAVRHA